MPEICDRLGRYVLRRCLQFLPPRDSTRVGLCAVSLYAVHANAWGEAAHARLLSRHYGVPRDEILPFYNSRRDLSAELGSAAPRAEETWLFRTVIFS